jgi:hypothetical protein
VVQHSYANTFTGIIPAAWVKKGLQITVTAGAATTNLTNLDIGAPTKVIMTMFDVQYFSDTNDNYPANTFAELEAKWPVADLELRRLGHVVFPELVIPPRRDLGGPRQIQGGLPRADRADVRRGAGCGFGLEWRVETGFRSLRALEPLLRQCLQRLRRWAGRGLRRGRQRHLRGHFAS